MRSAAGTLHLARRLIIGIDMPDFRVFSWLALSLALASCAESRGSLLSPGFGSSADGGEIDDSTVDLGYHYPP
jgi:hypothetical protein